MAAPADEPEFIRRQHEFTRHLRNPQQVPAPAGLPPQRLAVYSNAVYLNIERFMRDNFPRVREVFDEADWHALVRDYLVRHRSDTALFAELLDEFLAYLDDERTVASDPPYLRELAHFDWLENAVAIAATRLDELAAAPDGDLLRERLVINPVHQLVRYTWPVHAIGPDFRPEAPPARPTWLLAFRDRAGSFGVLDLNDVAVRLFSAVSAAEAPPAVEVLESLARELAHPDPAVVVNGGLALLERWRAREVILGTAPRG